jgi:hypothetical protein
VSDEPSTGVQPEVGVWLEVFHGGLQSAVVLLFLTD